MVDGPGGQGPGATGIDNGPRRLSIAGVDNLTHGLLGLAIGALRRPDGGRGAGLPFSPTDRAVIFGSVLAAELPDLDTFLPAANPVMHALHAHRGLSHALAFAPIWALVATLLARLLFRQSRWQPVFAFSLSAVLFAHLASDLWTGWGTRLLLPFSDARLSLDLSSVVDPFFTLPLLIGAVWAFSLSRARPQGGRAGAQGVVSARGPSWRRAILAGLAISTIYLGFRTVSRELLIARVQGATEGAVSVEVFPAILSMTQWRYVAVDRDGYRAGIVPLFGPPQEQRRLPFSSPLPPEFASNQTVSEAIAWARLPFVSVSDAEDGGRQIRIADLRYHLAGEPTLAIVVDVDREGAITDARLDRGGNVKEVFTRWRKSR